MNKAVTSKEELLIMAKNIIVKDGIGALSIRRLAKECQVAVGSVYNYFPSKADLIFTMVEEFFKSSFHEKFKMPEKEVRYTDILAKVYQELKSILSQFRSDFLAELSIISKEEKEYGKQIEERYWKHMKKGLLIILKRDSAVKKDLWTKEFSQEKFVEYSFLQMMSVLRGEILDFNYIQTILEHILYEKLKEE